MREIKFRGKRIDNGEWAYGYYAVHKMMLTGETDYFIVVNEQRPQSIDPETVGQYTGLKDEKGKEICEGDIVTWFVNDTLYAAPVYFDTDQASFWMGEDINKRCGLVLNDWMRGEYEVIGNIYEHPHLLREAESNVHQA